MACIYAMSDMHGDMEAFEQALSVVDLTDPDNRLILCGDYTDPSRDLTLPHAIMELQDEHPGQVIALMGNHELAAMDELAGTPKAQDPAFGWMHGLPYFYETPTQIFVHAGVDEEAEDLWKVGTENAYFCEKFPYSTGPFLKDVIAGHIGTSRMANDPDFHDVYWDGASHYYLDGTVHVSHHIPVLKYDTEKEHYTAFRYDADGRPYEDGLEEMGAFEDDPYLVST